MADRIMNEEGQDDWETLDDNGELDKQIDALANHVQKSKEEMQNNTPKSGPVPLLQNYSDHPGSYTPTIKLLKRDPLESASAAADLGDRRPNYKTLEQREAEYAEARKRILGDAVEPVIEPVEILSAESSPIVTLRSNTRKTESAVTRQPISPAVSSKGFPLRKKSVEHVT